MKMRQWTTIMICTLNGAAWAGPPEIGPLDVRVVNSPDEPIAVTTAITPFQVREVSHQTTRLTFPAQTTDVIIRDVSVLSRLGAGQQTFPDYIDVLNAKIDDFISCRVEVVDLDGVTVTYSRVVSTESRKVEISFGFGFAEVEAASNVHIFVPAGQSPRFTCLWDGTGGFDSTTIGNLSGYALN